MMGPLEALVKSLIVNAAATMTAGVVSNLPDDLKADAEIANDETKVENTMSARVHHVFVGYLSRFMDPKSGVEWADWLKDLDAKSLAPNTPVFSLLSQLIGAIPRPSSPLPSLPTEIPLPKLG